VHVVCDLVQLAAVHCRYQTRSNVIGFTFECREAAKQIEQENNQGKDLWEIDLHGLHRQEAEVALDKRSVHPMKVQ